MKAYSWSLIFFCLITTTGVAQNIIGAFNAGKGNLNVAVSYTSENFEEYYVGKEAMVLGLMDVSVQTIGVYAEYGLLDRLDLIVNLPFITTTAENENLPQMSEFQDLSMHAKYAIVNPDNSKFLLTGALGFVVPASDYDPLVPVTVGTHVFCTQGSLAGLVRLGGSFFGELDVSYIIKNEDAPNTFRGTSKLGWAKNRFYGHVWYANQISAQGYDLGESGGSFQSLETNFNRVGIYTSYNILQMISASVGVGTTLSGTNVGKTSFISLGIIGNLDLK